MSSLQDSEIGIYMESGKGYSLETEPDSGRELEPRYFVSILC